jgi:hypothetical protein
MSTTTEASEASGVLERIAVAACERAVAQVNEEHERVGQVAQEFESALHDAVSQHARLVDIATAEATGLERAKSQLRREVLRGIERGAKARSDGQAAWEAAVRRGGRLGLGNVEIASVAGVTHAAVRKVLERSDNEHGPFAAEPHDQPSEELSGSWNDAADG